MRCPKCGYFKTAAYDTRPRHDGLSIHRRRECVTCGFRFTTTEIQVVSRPQEAFLMERMLSHVERMRVCLASDIKRMTKEG